MFGAHFSKNRSLLGLRFRRVFSPCSKLAQFLPSFVSSNVFTSFSSMPLAKMFFWRYALKIFRSIVGLYSIDVVDMFSRVKIIQPTFCYNTVHQSLPTQNQISSGVIGGDARLKLPQNFAAARHSIQVVKYAVFNAVHHKADHVEVPFYYITFLPQTERNVQ